MRFALPGSIGLHMLIVLGLIFLAGREVLRQQPSGLMPITVHLMTLAPLPPVAPAIVEKPAAKPVVKKLVVKAKTQTAPEKPAPSIAAAKSSAPAQSWQEAKSENQGPKILAQPMPNIPEDLRREAFSTSAVAKFHVAADGSANVELLTPSQNPRLNHMLLEALKNWKFSPALENGKAVEADFQIRVHFAVE